MFIGSVKWLLLASVVSLAALEHDYVQNAQGRNLLDLVGLGTGPETDPYVAKTNAQCLNGDLAECFKSHALSSFGEFFEKPSYQLTEHARILRMPENQVRQLRHEPYEYSSEARADDPEWDQLVKFAMRKVERFLKSTTIAVEIDDEVTEQGRYSPRFLDEIADEIDVIEDKKDSYFKRKQLQKLFIPMLLILKLFKLKLLLFLPLILGLASFKKLLGFLAIIIPGLIGFFKLCKPNLQTPNFYPGPQYTQAGIGYQQTYLRDPKPTFLENYQHQGGGGVHFRDENNPQYLAYNGWDHYGRSNGGKDIQAETKEEHKENTSRKSILPDS